MANNRDDVTEEQRDYLHAQTLVLEKAKEVLSDAALLDQYDLWLKEELGIKEEASWWERLLRGLINAGCIVGGATMIVCGMVFCAPSGGAAIGSSIGGSALLNAGIKTSLAQCSHPHLSRYEFTKSLGVGGLQGAAGGAIGIGFGLGAIAPAMEAGQYGAAIVPAGVSGAVTATAGLVISDAWDESDGTKWWYHTEIHIESVAGQEGHYEVTVRDDIRSKTGCRVRFYNDKNDVAPGEPDGSDFWLRVTGKRTLLLFKTKVDANCEGLDGIHALRSQRGRFVCCHDDGTEIKAVCSLENARSAAWEASVGQLFWVCACQLFVIPSELFFAAFQSLGQPLPVLGTVASPF
jgi:hypothetical protein